MKHNFNIQNFRFKRMNRFVFVFFFLQFYLSSIAQEKETWAKENIQFNGYLKYINTTSFQSNANNEVLATLNDNLLHNRLNLKVFLNQHFTATAALRNRVFWGNSLQVIPNYSNALELDNQALDMSMLLIDEPALIVLSKIDRLHLAYQSKKWQVTLGRQRINWGKNLVWNPNDLFNTYSFFDFDYEEHPGTDALRIHYFTSGNSSIETAINYTENWEDNTMAIKYNFNKFNYDFQVLGAKYQTDYMIGLGWEGAVKNLGLKGEISYFTPQEKSTRTQETIIGSVSLDYYFKNGVSINVSTLYNQRGITNTTSFNPSQFNSIQLSAKNLMPNKLSFFAQLSKPLTPALSTSFSGIYAKELNAVFVMPQLSYNMAQNWDLDTTAQLFYGKREDSNETINLSNAIYLRFRWSF